MKEFHPFEPFIDENSRVLILGSFPSFASKKIGFYYGHRQNQFWKILSTLFGESEPKTLQEKKEFLKRHHIALWDMVSSCTRTNSLDSSLKNVQVNDIAALIENYPNIKAIFTTGRKSETLYKRHFSNIALPMHYLPSPSPANRGTNFDQKVDAYKIILDYIDEINEPSTKKRPIDNSGKKIGAIE